LTEAFAPMIPTHGEDAIAMLGASGADAGVLARAGARERLAAMLDIAFDQGATGMALDVAGYCLRPWGFDPADVKAKTLLLYGSKDPIGQPHATWWKNRIPDARVEMFPGCGHLVAIAAWKRALSHLSPRRGTSG